ncbi:MAG TPA: Fe-S protein assembly co-chaperone HscB [Alphaproteobacteria bacterium]
MNELSSFIAATPAPAAPTTCWSCKGPVDATALFCPTCRAVQPPHPADHFTRLGLPVSFAVDAAELDRRYFAAQRLLHPDRFATKTPRERAISQSQAVGLNAAYETLKDPLARATYLLSLKGVSANPDGCHTVNDPTLLMEQMERREALMEAASPEAVDAIAREAASHVRDSEAAIAAAFAGGDLEKAGRETTRLKYLVKLVEEARARKAKLAASEKAK